MITMGFAEANYPSDYSGTFVVTCGYTATASWFGLCNTSYYLPRIDAPDPKRKIPFYRALFDQDFPQPIAPKKIQPRIQRWNPHMGRVRIDRTRQ